MSFNSTECHRHSSLAPWTYRDLIQRQSEIAEGVRRGEPGKLLLSEVAPVVTFGRQKDASGLRMEADAIEKCGIELLTTDRGGKVTYHGTGQWLLFPVEAVSVLSRGNKSVREIIQKLLDLSLAVCREYVPGAICRGDEEVGVWSGSDDRATKLVSVGVRIARGVLHHGICVNGYETELSFRGIWPCGLEGRAAGYLLSGGERDPGRAFETLGERLLSEGIREFNCFSSSESRLKRP